MEYGTYLGTAKPVVTQYDSGEGISATGVLTLAAVVAIAVAMKWSGRTKKVPQKTDQPTPPGKAVPQPPGNLPSVSMDVLQGNDLVTAPAVPSGNAAAPAAVEKGRSILGAPAVKVWAGKMDIPYELAQRLQKHEWSAMCSRRKLPGLERGDVERTPYGVAVHVQFGNALDFPTVQRGISQIETGLDVADGTIRLRKGATAGRGILDVRLRDPLEEGTPWEAPSVPVRLAHPVKLAVTPFGDTIEMSVKQRIGVFGTSGSGKSCVQRLIGAHVAQAIDAEGEIWDFKHGVESQHYAGKARRVTTVEDAVDRVDWLLNSEYPRRAAKMKERGVSEWVETPWDPALVIILDEGNAVIRGFGEWREEDEDGKPAGTKGLPLKDLFTLVEQGRALGVYWVWATQFPKAANLPTEIRSQLNATVCLKLRTDGEARVVFGDDVSDGWAPQDLYGPGWLLLQDDAHTDPVDAKAVWLSVDTFRSVPIGGTVPDKARLVSRTPGQSLSSDNGTVPVQETGQDTDRTDVSLDKGQDSETVPDTDTDRADVSTDVWLVLSVSETPQGVSELARRAGRSKSAVHAALQRMTEDGRVLRYGAGYRLRTTEEK